MHNNLLKNQQIKLMMLGNINFGPILQILMLGNVTKQYFQIQRANIVKVMELVENNI
jgi:hypothetical protein